MKYTNHCSAYPYGHVLLGNGDRGFEDEDDDGDKVRVSVAK